MAIPNRYQLSPGAPITTFSYIDFAQSTGYVTFYGVDVLGGTYKITQNTIYAQIGLTSDSTTNGNYELMHDIDFDIVFNRPARINGVFFITIPYKQNSSAGSTSTDFYSVVTIRHWDGSTETDKGTSGSSSTAHNVSSATTEYGVDTHAISVTNVNFRRGETLRVTVQTYGRTNGGGTCSVDVAHDPANRDLWTTGDITRMQILTPFAVVQ